MLLIIMYIHLQYLKYIKNIIKCNVVPYMYIQYCATTHPLYTPTDYEIY